jgi:hypothetical protein
MAERHILVTTVIDFGREALSAIDGSVTLGDERFDFILTRERAQAEFVSRDAPRTVQYQYRAYSWERAAGGQRSNFESPLLTTDASIIVIDPRDLYRLIRVMGAAVFDMDRFSAAFVDLKAEPSDGSWSQVETFRLSKEASEAAVFFLVDRATTLTFQQRTRYVKRGGEVIDLPWQPAGEGTLVIGNPTVEVASPVVQ